MKLELGFTRDCKGKTRHNCGCHHTALSACLRFSTLINSNPHCWIGKLHLHGMAFANTGFVSVRWLLDGLTYKSGTDHYRGCAFYQVEYGLTTLSGETRTSARLPTLDVVCLFTLAPKIEPPGKHLGALGMV
jgi:hypothetical protein